MRPYKGQGILASRNGFPYILAGYGIMLRTCYDMAVVPGAAACYHEQVSGVSSEAGVTRAESARGKPAPVAWMEGGRKRNL